jgi:hypothetical protein
VTENRKESLAHPSSPWRLQRSRKSTMAALLEFVSKSLVVIDSPLSAVNTKERLRIAHKHRGMFSDWYSCGVAYVLPLKHAKHGATRAPSVYIKERCPHCSNTISVRKNTNYNKNRRALLHGHGPRGTPTKPNGTSGPTRPSRWLRGYGVT